MDESNAKRDLRQLQNQNGGRNAWGTANVNIIPLQEKGLFFFFNIMPLVKMPAQMDKGKRHWNETIGVTTVVCQLCIQMFVWICPLSTIKNSYK